MYHMLYNGVPYRIANFEVNIGNSMSDEWMRNIEGKYPFIKCCLRFVQLRCFLHCYFGNKIMNIVQSLCAQNLKKTKSDDDNAESEENDIRLFEFNQA